MGTTFGHVHRMFNDIDELLSDSMKILCLKGGSFLETGLSSKEVTKVLPGLRDNFGKYTSHLTESVINRRSHLEALKSVPQMHQISMYANRLSSHTGRGLERGYGKGHR